MLKRLFCLLLAVLSLLPRSQGRIRQRGAGRGRGDHRPQRALTRAAASLHEQSGNHRLRRDFNRRSGHGHDEKRKARLQKGQGTACADAQDGHGLSGVSPL